jgi:hypothetical protein
MTKKFPKIVLTKQCFEQRLDLIMAGIKDVKDQNESVCKAACRNGFLFGKCSSKKRR